MKKVAFFLGKGGVGKTTLSSATAYNLSRRGRKTLIVSLDPAHNLGDVFGRKLSNTRSRLAVNLDGMEVDLQEWISRYLKESREEIQATYRYNTTLNLDSYLNIMKYTPGTEEYAVLWAIEHVVKEHGAEYDRIVFDTPPTALTLRFLAMPTISMIWVRELQEMRERILKKRQTILSLNPEAHVIKGSSRVEDDRIYGKLSGIQTRLSWLHQLFKENSYLTVIINPDNLSLAEAVRIRHELEKLDVPIDSVCFNKAPSDGACGEEVKQSFHRFPIFTSVYVPEGLRTMDDLIKVEIPELVEDMERS
ncbi:MAG: ArsA family ATPase [Spirochaetales bacterium]